VIKHVVDLTANVELLDQSIAGSVRRRCLSARLCKEPAAEVRARPAELNVSKQREKEVLDDIFRVVRAHAEGANLAEQRRATLVKEGRDLVFDRRFAGRCEIGYRGQDESRIGLRHQVRRILTGAKAEKSGEQCGAIGNIRLEIVVTKNSMMLTANRIGWLVVPLALASACGGAPPPATTAAPAAPAEPAPGPPPAVGIYVTNEQSGDLSVVDAASQTVVATIPLGKRPRGIVPSPDRTLLYVALSGSPSAPPGTDEKQLPPPDRSADGIGVVDIAKRKLVKVLTSGPDPEQVALSHDGTRLFVANEDAARLTVINTADGAVVEMIKVGEEPEGVSVHPDGTHVYVTSEGDGAVFVVDMAKSKVVKSVKVGPRPRSVAFLPDGSRAYVPSENGGTLSLIDTKRLATVKTIKLGDGIRPMGTVMAKDGKHLYVSTGRSKMVYILDTATNQVAGMIEAGPRPWGIGLAPDGKTIYTANGPSNDMSVIDLDAKQVTKKIPLGRGPWGVAVVERPK
jgi:YVTN family beta-propeller protein